MKKLFVGGLPPTTTEKSLQALFSPYRTARSLKLVKDLFSGDCKGFGFLEMEGHEARAAISALDGAEFEGSQLRVGIDRPRPGGKRGGRRR